MNSKSIRTVYTLLALIGVLGGSSAGAAEDQAKSDLQEVRRLLGKWDGAGTMRMRDGKKIPIKARWECAEAAAGSGVRCHMEITGMPNGFVYVVDDLWGRSEGDALVHWYAVTNGGEVHDHRGHFANGASVLTFDGPMNGKLFSETVRFKFLAANKLSLSSEVTLGGEPIEGCSIEFMR